MARIKEIVSLDGKKGRRVVKAKGKRSSRSMTKKELDLKNKKNNVMVFGGLKGGNTVRKNKNGKKVYTGGGF